MSEKPKKEMSRGTQTFLILVGMAVVLVFYLDNEKASGSTDPYAECYTISARFFEGNGPCRYRIWKERTGN